VKQLWLDTNSHYWSEDAGKMLARAKYDGTAETIPMLAAHATAGLAPVQPEALRQRLTMLGMSMANGRDAAEATAWLHESTRLLEDLPETVLFQAIDDCVKASSFLPSVKEIRDRADPAFRKLQRQAARLNVLRQMLEHGVPLPQYVPPPEDAWNPKPKDKPWFPKEGETAQIIAEVRASLAGKSSSKTPQELGAEGREMPRPPSQSPVWNGLPTGLDEND
jgi:hypothetical protein